MRGRRGAPPASPIRLPPRRTGTGRLLAQARAQAFSRGFFDQTAQRWNQAGRLLATTHQIVYFMQ